MKLVLSSLFFGCLVVSTLTWADSSPVQPTTLPPAAQNINPQAITSDGANYCAQITALSSDFSQNGAIAANLVLQLKQEAQVAAKLCDPNGKFLGYRNVADVNAQTMVNVGAIKDSYWKLQGIAQLAGLTASRSSILMWYNQFTNQTLMVFYEGQLQNDFPNTYDSSDFQDRKSQLEHWGASLNNYYRQQ